MTTGNIYDFQQRISQYYKSVYLNMNSHRFARALRVGNESDRDVESIKRAWFDIIPGSGRECGHIVIVIIAFRAACPEAIHHHQCDPNTIAIVYRL